MAKPTTPDSTALARAKEEVQKDSGGKTKRAVLKIPAKGPTNDLEIPHALQVIASTGLSKKTRAQAKKLLKASWSHLPEVRALSDAAADPKIPSQ
jgi:hypothetical protein